MLHEAPGWDSLPVWGTGNGEELPRIKHEMRVAGERLDFSLILSFYECGSGKKRKHKDAGNSSLLQPLR